MLEAHCGIQRDNNRLLVNASNVIIAVATWWNWADGIDPYTGESVSCDTGEYTAAQARMRRARTTFPEMLRFEGAIFAFLTSFEGAMLRSTKCE